ncbi:hypothetical protein GCM10010218_49440 [Streptomyces mashuensis]|uniref:Uncharacterized protein n=1 Tax=Streptomyces mashuensis TaxID=33904 RepID=A0A919B742_9ACTN|nr:hypothetical protein [Streptomyces mashuensis]GHF61925.1 hypothetical protein GCM10010218_49440 [Streptomyces mashuensis]
MRFSGDFEVHVTGRAGDAGRLEEVARLLGVKFTHIELARGRVVSQPMVTWRGAGELEGVRERAGKVVRELERRGVGVVRVKVEASPWAAGVPVTDAEAVALGAAYYFEHHVKLLLPPGTDPGPLTRLAVAHGAHLSRNPRRVRADGHAERFVTQRCHRMGRTAAGARLEALTGALVSEGYDIVSSEREFVVHDSDASLDAGWIGEEGARA